MNRKLQVFISSTYKDMLSERQAAVEATLRSGHIPAGMELFAAADESQLQTIRRWIDDSDVFMLILGGRYGSIEPKSGKSYIHLEYEYAIERKKPLFAAVISADLLDSKVRSMGPLAIETDNGAAMKAFRETVLSRICREFSDLNDLKVNVFESLSHFDRNEHLAGWVRGTDTLPPKAVLELQNENSALRKQIEELRMFLAQLAEKNNVESSLSSEAKELLLSAALNSGYIMYSSYLNGTSLQAGNKEFLHQATPRMEAVWKGALGELSESGLIEDVNGTGEIFKVTRIGYDIADRLSDSNPSSPTRDSVPTSAAE